MRKPRPVSRDVPRGLGGDVADRPHGDGIVGGSDVKQDRGPKKPVERPDEPPRPEPEDAGSGGPTAIRGRP